MEFQDILDIYQVNKKLKFKLKVNWKMDVFQVLNNNLGYGGYINGVRSENLYGKTYGKTTFETG